ncbi:MAG TPA: hypothetical protein VF619_11735 [Allosphingosinicella sp.]
MREVFRFLPFLVLLSGCVAGPTERPLSVEEVVENASALNGREIVVVGWLDQCFRFSCGIYASAKEAKKDFPYYLSIGRSRWFDSFAQRAAPTRIALRARLDDRCISNPATEIIALCTDRSGTLEPLALIRWPAADMQPRAYRSNRPAARRP